MSAKNDTNTAPSAQLEAAVRRHEAGDFQEAESAYRRVLAVEPRNPQALQLAGILALQRGDAATAVVRLQKRVDLGNAPSGSWLLLGRAYQAAQAYPEAIACHQQALAIEPDFLDAKVCLALALSKSGDAPGAESAYRAALAQNPGCLEAALNLGNRLLADGRADEALQISEAALPTHPGDARLLFNAGRALRQLDRKEQAIDRLHEAVKADPDFLEAYLNLGNVLVDARNNRGAESVYRALIQRCDALRASPNPPKSLETIRQDAPAALAGALVWTYQFEEAMPLLREALEREPHNRRFLEHLLVASPYRLTSRAEIAEAYRVYGKALGGKPAPRRTEPAATPAVASRSKLTVGLVSGDFRDHSMAFFLEPLLEHYDRDALRIICLSNNPKDDEVTERLRRLPDEWIECKDVPDIDLLRLIQGRSIDVLIDLAGRTEHNRLGLFSTNVAPVQMGYLGYPTYTGIPTIQWRLTDRYIDPDDGDLETERPVQLPRSQFCYRPAADSPAVPERTPKVEGAVTFASFNSLAKLAPETIRLWSRILKRLPASRLLLKTFALSDESARQALLRQFESEGIDAGRIELRGGEASRADHLRLYGSVDIALDSYPYNGATTTCEALWMGTPVVTLAGETHASRMGLSILSEIGHPELVAQSADEYESIAIGLATDPNRLHALQSGLRAEFQASSLRDETGFARDFVNVIHRIWQTQNLY